MPRRTTTTHCCAAWRTCSASSTWASPARPGSPASARTCTTSRRRDSAARTGGRITRGAVRRSVRGRAGGAVLGDLVEHRVLLAGVDPVLELDDAELGEALAQEAVVAVEQAELLAVRHDLGEQDVLELLAPLVGHDEPHRVLDRHAHALPHLLLQEAITHADRGLERELLAV